jgi:tetratricopeptide (TPR) repeat protein
VVGGPNHPNTLIDMSQLALAYEDVGRFDESLALFQKILERRRAILGAKHPRTQISMQCLARTLIQRGRFDEGLKLLQELVP